MYACGPGPKSASRPRRTGPSAQHTLWNTALQLDIRMAPLTAGLQPHVECTLSWDVILQSNAAFPDIEGPGWWSAYQSTRQSS